jgi:tRNA modification GTPase
MRVYNKIDLTGHAPAVVRERGITTVWLSALTGAGVDGFRNALLALAGWGGRSEGLYIARARHVQALDTARIHLGQAIGVTERLELLAEELRLTQEALSAITGGYTSDELLGEIFSRFCVGK